MAEARWTPEQERAISLRGCNILVSAAAGAGKTSVLVERVIRLVLDPAVPLDLERLLAVTFTEKAAAEMKQRIRTSLEDASETSPGADHRYYHEDRGRKTVFFQDRVGVFVIIV